MPLAPPVMTAARPSNLLPNLPVMFRSAIGNFASPSLKDAAGQGLPLPNRRFRAHFAADPISCRSSGDVRALPAPLLQHANTQDRTLRADRAAEGDALLLRADGLQLRPYRQPADLCVRGSVAAHDPRGGIRPAPCDEHYRCRPSRIGRRPGRRQDDAGRGARAKIALGHRPLLRGRILPPHRHDEDPPARHRLPGDRAYPADDRDDRTAGRARPCLCRRRQRLFRHGDLPGLSGFRAAADGRPGGDRADRRRRTQAQPGGFRALVRPVEIS